MYKVVFTSQFKKDIRRASKRGLNLAKFEAVLGLLSAGAELPISYKDHALTGNWVGYRELHIQPDWLLIYYVENDLLVLTLARTGTHSDLFTK